jgi:hypothetical protein
LGLKIKGGMYCRRCGKPVMAQKNGHGVRNVVAVGGTLATAGLSLFGAKSEKWRCPMCGGPCVPESQVRTNAAIMNFVGSRGERKKAAGGAKAAWRCEKNGHKLDKGRTHCPIDGSPASWREP